MVSSSSKNQYVNTYKFLVSKAGTTDIKEIFKFIKNAPVKDSSKLAYLNSLISLKKIDESLIKGDLTDIVEMRDKLNISHEEARAKNNITEGQAKTMDKISFKDIQKKMEELKENKDKSIKDLENYLIVSILMDYPLRNDLQEVILTTKKGDLRKAGNVLYIPRKGNAVFSLKEYKTATTYGDKLFDISSEISDSIRTLKKHHPQRVYLFQNGNNDSLTSSAFTQRVNKIFKDVAPNIGTTILRKLYLNHKYKDVVKEMAKDSAKMGHSVDTQRKTYISNKK